MLRATEWTESLRDLVTTILETNLTIQGNRLNIIIKKVTSWAAIIAVPTLDHRLLREERALPRLRPTTAGFTASVATIVLAGLMLYLVFKRNDWL